MIGERKSQKMKEQILELYRRKNGKKKIAKMLGISKNTVKGVIRAIEVCPVDGVSMTATFGADSKWVNTVHWSDIKNELRKKYVTIKSLHADYAPAGVEYLKFWREIKKRFPEDLENKACIRFQYKP